MKIPVFLQHFLSKNHYVLKEIIQFSNWKQTFVLKISNQDNEFILKSVTDTTPREIKSKFKTETEVYLKNLSDHVPNIFLATDSMIITEYIEGKTLREYLNEGNDPYEILEVLGLAIQAFYETNKVESSSHNSFKIVYNNITSLALSGPLQTRNLSFLNKIINKIILFNLKAQLKRELHRLNLHNLKQGFSHGDFHYNNIFITSDKKIKFIDFENVVYNEYFDFDVLYLLVMIEAKLGLSRNIGIYDNIMPHINEKEDLKTIYNIYKMAVSLNPRFCKEKLAIKDKLQLLLKLIGLKRKSSQL